MSASRLVTGFLTAAAVLALAAGTGASELYETHGDRHIDKERRPAAGKALVYVLHPPHGLRALEKLSVFLDGSLLGIMVPGSAGTFMATEVEPGRHEFAAANKNASILDADLAADRTYLIEVGSTAGMMTARAFILPVPPESKSLKELLKTKRVGTASGYVTYVEITTTEAGRQWVAEGQEKVNEAIERARKKPAEIEHLRPEDGFPTPPWTD
jgi:hypothetical protein